MEFKMIFDFWDCYEVTGNSWNWEAIGAIGTWFVGFIAAILTFYPLWLSHFSQKIKVLSMTSPRDIMYGDGVDIVLLNKTLSPKGISEISIVRDNKYILSIKEYKTPLVLEPMRAVQIIGDKYMEIPIDKFPYMSDIYFIITIDGKERFVKYRGRIIKYNRIERLNKLERIAFEKKKFGDKFLSKAVKYALYYKVGEIYKTTIILDNGMIDESPFYFNVFPKEAMKTTDSLIEFIKKNFPKIDFKIQEL